MAPDDAPRGPLRPHDGDTSRASEWGADTPFKNDGVVAVLGPTNTGKTHYAVERMLGHRTGVIGFPLRLLAREIYDRVIAMRGPRDVALITGEEKIVPVDARYYICTVESMPLDWSADFVAVDEIQLCGDPERGHVFTDRLLNARGRHETLFLGALTMREKIAALVPGARFMTRQRLSTLTYSGSKKLSRLPPRAAVVGFSTDTVYAIAELIRRQKGGAAVVTGALSPRTRNAQVALYQEGDVDYLVATDAIGMGLNMDVRHVAFAGLRKFDGRRHRELHPNELAQIAGRAGRHANDGTFGVTGEARPLDEEVVDAIENHRFSPVQKLQWRNGRLDYANPGALIRSLERESPNDQLARAREADDLVALRALARDEEIADRARGRPAVRLLWDVCQVPDFRKTMPTEHAALLAQIYRFLVDEPCEIPEEWLAAHCARVDRTEGDIDALSKRLAYIRTWTYVANRVRWVRDPGHWRERTRAIEDRLSDALHARLTQRFVDRRTSVLARRLKQKESLVAMIDDAGAVTVEGEFVGRLSGFHFEPDPAAAGAEMKTLQAASVQALQSEFSRRIDKFYRAEDGEIDVTEQGGLMWGDSAVGRLAAKNDPGDPLAVNVVAYADDMIEPALREKIERRLQFWIDRKLQAAFEPLFALRDDPEVAGIARGVAFQLLERYGVLPRQQAAEEIKALDQDARAKLRKHGVRFGQYTVFLQALLKPAPTRFRLLLWGLAQNLDEIPSPPPPGHVTIPAEEGVPEGFYAMAGYRLAGPRAIRLDMMERLADMIRGQDARAGFEATPEMLSITGATLEQFAQMMEGLGFRAEKGERPKTAKAQAKPSTSKGRKSKAKAADQPAAEAAAEAAPNAAPAENADAAPADAPETQNPEPAETPVEAGARRQPAEPTADADADLAAETPAAETPAAEATPRDLDAVAEQGAAVSAPAEDLIDAPPPADDESPTETAEPQAEAADAQATDAEPTEAPTDDAPTEHPPTEAPETVVATAEAPEEEASKEEAPEDAKATQDAADPDKPHELETFYTFRILPRGRRQRGDGEREGGRGRRRHDGGAQRSGDRDGPTGTGERSDPMTKAGDRPRREDDRGDQKGRSGKPPRRQKGKPGGKPGGQQKPREYGSAPPRREKKADPDSPFAILQKLKDGS